MKKSWCFWLCAFLCILVYSVQAEVPYWWDNAHKDDEFDMYERGSAACCAGEQEALRQAVLAAKDLLIERIGIVPALKAAGLRPSPEYALVNCETADAATEQKGRTWSAWVLLKYPQTEKEKILARWNDSIASINELTQTEDRIPVQFGLSLETTAGYTQYREGEYVGFTVKSGRDAYLVLLDHQSDGTTVLLFPNRFHPDCYIRKGEVAIIPDPTQTSFQLVVGQPFGDDRIEAIASTQYTSLQTKLQGMLDDLSGTAGVAVASRGLFIQEVGKAVSSTGMDTLWSRAELNISTYQK